jgi:formylglycine-generating enzyme required for sulfatase activity
MITSAFWILPLAIVTFLTGPAGPSRAVQSPPKEVRNGVGMRLVEIPGGSFDMGSTVGPGEAPVHRVTVRSFWMGVTEVTQAQWQAVMGNNPSHFRQGGPNAPVEMVGWDDVQAFVRRLNEREQDWRYRLPSEAEWEYPCLARTAKDPCGPGRGFCPTAW